MLSTYNSHEYYMVIKYTKPRGNRVAFKIREKSPDISVEAFVFALPIFPGSRPPSIVGVHVLNFCVRDGNRWTHMTINTNYLVTHTGFEPMLTA